MSQVRKLVPTKAFEKSYKKFTSRNQVLQSAVAKALVKLQADAHQASLKTHKLSGNLAAYFACSCGYDCRIIFSIEANVDDPEAEYILLLDIGTHNDVY